jgi:small-conductance mechanosensitive channel
MVPDWQNLFAVIRPLAVFVLLSGAALLIRRLGFVVLERWTRRRGDGIGSILLTTLRVPSVMWALALGLYGALEASDLPPRLVTLFGLTLRALIILSVTLVAVNLTTALISLYGARRAFLMPVTGLTQAFARAMVLILGGLVLLGSLGIAITPLLTALGVGGLAVALALQDTLKNLFAGMHILADRPIRVGDYVRLESGEQGSVQDIGWRSTRLRMLRNNLIVIPNAKLAESIVVNYSLPEARTYLRVRVGASYGSDPAQVETALLDVASDAAREVPGVLADPAPFVRFIGFGESALDFGLFCHVAEITDELLVRHELRKRIVRRFREEGIDIPFPIRTVHLREDECSGKRSPPSAGPPRER